MAKFLGLGETSMFNLWTKSLLIKNVDFCCLHSFPTIYFAPMKSKDTPKKYNGGRDVNSFLEYLKREATNPFEAPAEKKKKKKTKKDKDEL